MHPRTGCPRKHGSERFVFPSRCIPPFGVRLAVLIPAALVTGCAAGASNGGGTQDRHEVRTVTVQGSDGSTTELSLRRDHFVARSQLALPRTELLPVAREVWIDFGLPEPDIDPRSFTLSLSNQVLPRRIANDRLSRYLECGSSLSGVNADTHRVRGNVQTVLEAVDRNETRFVTRIEATAHVISGTSGPPIRCMSTGVLEERLIAEIQRRTGAARRPAGE
jgi:hypothetical protein